MVWPKGKRNPALSQRNRENPPSADPEVRRRIGDTQRGRPRPAEVVDKIRRTTRTDEFRAKASEHGKRGGRPRGDDDG